MERDYSGRKRRDCGFDHYSLSCMRGIGTTGPIGSTLLREHEFYRKHGEVSPQPRQRILSDLRDVVVQLQNDGHAIVLMMDANGTTETDKGLKELLAQCDLIDLHKVAPAPSTYIGSAARRIDYIFGCPLVASTVTRQGSLAYTEGPQSDHRGIYVDLDIDALLGAMADQPMPYQRLRPLSSGNPKLVANYLVAMRKYYSDHHMAERITNLKDNHHDMPRQQVRKLLTAWDNDQGRAMQHAEMTLQIKPKPYKWSPKLRNAGVIMRYWKLRMREVTQNADYSETFSRWESMIRQYDSEFTLPEQGADLPLATIRLRLNESSKQLRTIQKHSLTYRQQSFDDMLLTYETDQNPSTKQESKRRAKIVRRTIMGESCRRIFANIRSMVKPGEYNPLSKIKVPRHRNHSCHITW